MSSSLDQEERERERESFIRNNLHNGVVSEEEEEEQEQEKEESLRT